MEDREDPDSSTFLKSPSADDLGDLFNFEFNRECSCVQEKENYDFEFWEN